MRPRWNLRLTCSISSFALHRAVSKIYIAQCSAVKGSVAKIVKLEHAWRRLDGRNDDGFQVAPFPG
ncbi:hypothetical protein FH814_25050 [Salmonella enterica]|uniref:Uncharacterized protein n=1 Tax=Salmonella enterica TaxID=28901 RepID=A0A5Y3A312_SALER|nr:hypothetical protein [Salmonella enterica]EAW4851571.1 hypothetical protein [Salmonella enterica]EBB5024008.1 hypothetical protein [Salmonella enterica]EBD1403695.1 hypothetical protein [Salmonella enterica]EBF4603375.1 hypothetical protein [Salmonella enterica]